jgi:RNA polymerase sigma-70 factor (ECF subfamily)
MGGDIDAYSELVRVSHPRLFGVASLILRDSDRAQDAVQDALLLAWRHVRSLRDPDAWDAWLRRLTVRACYKVAKAHKRRTLVELHVTPDQWMDQRRLADVASATGSSELGRSTSPQAVLVLHYLDSPSEVAISSTSHTGRSRPAHRSRMRTVRADDRGRTGAGHGR